MGRSLQKSDFLIGWVCILEKEYFAATAVLEDDYGTNHDAGFKSSDSTYHLGCVAGHNVVINVPGGSNGLLSASQIAADMKNTFSCICFVLLVGIGGGAPSQTTDVRLGDVVLGTSVIPYRKGKQRDDKFEIEGRIETPPEALLAAVTRLELEIRHGKSLEHMIEQVQKPGGSKHMYRRPAEDRLLLSDFLHQDSTCDCLQPGFGDCHRLAKRRERASGLMVEMHKGIIGSADQVLRSAKERDRLSEEKNIICFEMEAAAVMKSMRCITVRGISDYSDGHKNDEWHEYAALSATVCARELLRALSPNAVLHTKFDITPEKLMTYVEERLTSAKKKMKRSTDQGDEETRESFKKANNELRECFDLVAKFKKQQGKAHTMISQDLKQLQKELNASVDELRVYVSQRATTIAASNPSTQNEWKELERQVNETNQRANGLEIVRDVFATGAKRVLFIGRKTGNRTALCVAEYLGEISDASGDMATIKKHISDWMRVKSSPSPSSLKPTSTGLERSIDTSRPSSDSRQHSRTEYKAPPPQVPKKPSRLKSANTTQPSSNSRQHSRTEHLQVSLPKVPSNSTGKSSTSSTRRSKHIQHKAPPPQVPNKPSRLKSNYSLS